MLLLPDMIHLICLILKFCLFLTILRLISTAFNWEFGVSRHYLRLLELLFQIGQHKIEKKESEHKLNYRQLQTNGHAIEGGCFGCSGDDTVSQRASSLALSCDQPIEEDSDFDEAIQSDGCLSSPFGSSGEELSGNSYHQPVTTTTATTTTIRERKVGCVTKPTELLFDQPRRQPMVAVAQPPPAKLRRISTPNGPPVFLLDDFDDENYNDISNGMISNNQEQQQQHCCNNQQINSTQYDSIKHEFNLEDACRFVIRGVSAIIDDQVTKRFTTEELKTWNMLTRTNAKNYQFMSRFLASCWFFGLLFRYTILLPLRIVFTLTGAIWLICTMSLVGLLPKSLRSKPYYLTSLMSFRMLACGITSRLHFHNRQYRAKNGDICVANHTSPLDAALLACDNCYALVGQRHGGVLGLLEQALSRATNHVWFDRSEMRDRLLVVKRLKEHASNRRNFPILIFPEGTCINNSAVMMFKKGSFEASDRVCPVAIKYDARFGDPFWNSSKQGYIQYLLLMMSSWAIKCDVWYLPPMERLPEETSAEFANRVKSEIARQGGLVDLAWDGQLKRTLAKTEWREQQQEDFANRLKLE